MYINERRAPPDLAFGHFDFDRDDHTRTKPDVLDEAYASLECRAYAVIGESVVLKRTTPLDPLFRPLELPAKAMLRESVYLGRDGGAPRFGVLIDDEALEEVKKREDLAVIGLRQLAIDRAVSPSHMSALATSKAMLYWHAKHRFCAVCGQPTSMAQGGWRRDCAACNGMHFPRTDPVVIMLAVRGEKCLLGRQARFPPGMYSCLAGFCEPGETIEDAVRREVWEEAGVKTARVRYLCSQPWPFPESLMIGCIAEAISDEITPDVTEMEDVRWFSREEAVAILDGRHPDKATAPGRIAIARVLLNAWAKDGAAFET
jgi:NAD+ diphosphatase